ncbi:inositol-pentakisphosphate 2-kinase isoform X1 [Salmo trutta]|uniref:Inositol-pentakisphosphate 2-kinase n=1 Tax=Salmo trutta TaxID=8032 RepID=A0A673X4X9_SALTR|nr:inositol-pentakisphosphate 2-kinase-like isoform X1 [Salmo trutta]
MELDKMDENDWKYHGEGNKSLVVSHVQHARVLRLLKYSTEDAENSHKTTEQAFRHIQNIVDYSQNVMKPLLGEKFIHNGEAVKLPLDFVRQLSLKVQQERPESRCDKVMDTLSGCALCLPNLTQLSSCCCCSREHRPPLCIEIKPKCGFLPASRHITKDIKRKVCRFCMHQHFKLANGKWKRLSHYCPLDLFSGNKQRMSLAIKHLIEEPQNNFNIFKGGECIYTCNDDADVLQDLDELAQHLRPYFLPSGSLLSRQQSSKVVLNELIQVIVSALLSTWDCPRSGQLRKTHLSEGRVTCEASLLHRDLLRNGNHCLPKDCVLDKILSTQMLDNLDIEGLSPLFKRVEQHLQMFPKERCRLQMDGPYNASFLEKVQNCPAEDDGSIEYAVGKVHQYRVAMTAKDCSIMVAIATCGEDDGLDQSLEIQPTKPRFTCSVSILDLDPKPYESISHQSRLDYKIVNHYLRRTQPNNQELDNLEELANQSLFLGRDRDGEDCTLVFHPV